MRLADAMNIGRPRGFRVAFEKRQGLVLAGDHFPERDEPLIATEDEAWRLAGEFAAKAPPEYVNIYVIDHTWQPVSGYRERMIRSVWPKAA